MQWAAVVTTSLIQEELQLIDQRVRSAQALCLSSPMSAHVDYSRLSSPQCLDLQLGISQAPELHPQGQCTGLSAYWRSNCSGLVQNSSDAAENFAGLWVMVDIEYISNDRSSVLYAGTVSI